MRLSLHIGHAQKKEGGKDNAPHHEEVKEKAYVLQGEHEGGQKASEVKGKADAKIPKADKKTGIGRRRKCGYKAYACGKDEDFADRHKEIGGKKIQRTYLRYEVASWNMGGPFLQDEKAGGERHQAQAAFDKTAQIKPFSL